jgi:hypothetical protein
VLILNFLDTFYYELRSFFIDIKNIIIDIIANLHSFLNKFMSDDIISIFFIAIVAIIAIFIFRAIINKE